MISKQKLERRPIVWVDPNSKKEQSKGMLEFMKKQFDVIEVESADQALKKIKNLKKSYNVICNNSFSKDVADKIKKREEVHKICIFCNNADYGKINCEKHGFDGYFTFLNKCIDFLIRMEDEKGSGGKLIEMEKQTYGKLLYFIGKAYQNAEQASLSEKFYSFGKAVNPPESEFKKQCQMAIQKLRQNR